MSLRLINLNSDLQKLVNEGYELQIKSSYLLIKSVPYINSSRTIKYGTLVVKLDHTGDRTIPPADHQAYLIGEPPCDEHGQALGNVINQIQTTSFAPDVTVNVWFSAKPSLNGGRYVDHYEKVTTYVAILEGPVQAIDRNVTAKNFRAVATDEGESPFRYYDTASSRAEIGMITSKLERQKIAIVGLGGTGAYVFDLMAKTPVDEIHTFDGDLYRQHNAFRSPGAPSVDDLNLQESKVAWFEKIYSKMHRGIKAHPEMIDAQNVAKLRGMDFVFLCIDNGPAKKLIVERLEEYAIPFVDVGLGVYVVDGQLAGLVALTTSTPNKRDHVRENGRISFVQNDAVNEYNTNIQIADLNMLNASLAVIRWKKLMGFYLDLEHEHHSAYTIDGNVIANEDKSKS